jgi:hypothetical protein
MPASLLSPLAIARYTVFAMACGTFGYYVVAILAAFRFFLRERKRVIGNFTLLVSVLKPVHGVDFASYENFRRLCEVGYTVL